MLKHIIKIMPNSKGLLHMRGWHKESTIWDFFKYDEHTGMSICQQLNCKRQLVSQNPTNLKCHFKAFHKDAFKDYEAEEENNVANTTSKSASANALKSVALHLTTFTVQRNIVSFCNEKDKD